jgi:hypothetical protein
MQTHMVVQRQAGLQLRAEGSEQLRPDRVDTIGSVSTSTCGSSVIQSAYNAFRDPCVAPSVAPMSLAAAADLSCEVVRRLLICTHFM